MEIHEEDYILGVWHAARKELDVLLTIKKKKDGEWEGEMRTRLYKDDKVFDSKDEKHFRTFVIPKKTTEEEVIQKNNTFLAVLSTIGFEIGYIEVKGNGERMAFLLAQEDWAHVKQLPRK